MLKRYGIKVLLNDVHPQAEVARLAGVLLRSVKRLTKEESIAQEDDDARQRECGIGRPNVVREVFHRKARFPYLKTIEGLDFALQSVQPSRLAPWFLNRMDFRC